ncbi:MAG: hypothetical protein A2V21_312540 [Deltaproteobacteria bacterium GWC2_55_46]|nr:MAG: hypothetical protein A2Z79_04970 [Deltaproteobacteria bacterium GWA2_55_82]OGQ63903.1 MAG: hypothetical protein A3I81_12685 [Deltaproteobacteria bacterium RIFCSPLOWO2_02_FULL_55_12]OIJ72770.1 MAG: hypothetical protein A2V21_312540 [Deltaproteobacteria bacterium GWC2_55_46]
MPEKLLMTTDAVGGVWTYSVELASALASSGVKVFLATMGPAVTRAQLKEATSAGADLFESGFKLEWMDDPWLNVELAGKWLLRIEEYTMPDIVHLNGYCHGALPWVAPCVIAAHSCVLSWWEAVRRTPVSYDWRRYAAEVEKGLSGARAVVAPTNAMLKSLKKHYSFDAPSDVIPNGRDSALFRPGTKKEEFILTAGRLWDEAKNIEALQGAAGGLSWPVYAAGALEHGAESFKADGSMRMLGALGSTELSGWMASASIFALPARYEPFGLTILEAALSGCALVLGDIPSLRETWEGAALFVNPDKPSSLAVTLESLSADKALRERLGALARDRALEFTPQRMAWGYIDIYRRLLAEGAERTERCVS